MKQVLRVYYALEIVRLRCVWTKKILLYKEMITPSDLMKRVGESGKLVPFFKAVGVYFTVGCGAPSASAAALKCAPVVCLLACVATTRRGAHARRVAAGLALSAAGDALLVWPHLFVAGMAAFAAAHLAYISAFGLRPLCVRGALLAYGATALFLRALTPPPPLRALVPAYAALLATMAWRGAATPGPQRYGALLFLLSDAILGYGLFGGSVPYEKVLVMTSYYSGQLGIALSALRRPPGARH
ncbi:lysoplasmalogenase [Pieris rapae]|uniref:lysoplasmalogenase n=1 Tax=Pieris rapae TaxID=64459 RepID=UPI001E27E8F5|nr:lysoplasmalogenase [Pieris rapae]